jgi:hypothetical protein
MMTLSDEDGTVNKKDSKQRPPKPNPSPTKMSPISNFAVIFDALSLF